MQSELSGVQVGCYELRQAWFWHFNMRLSVFFNSCRGVLIFLVLMFWDRLRRCPLTAASQWGMRDELRLCHLFYAPLLGEQAVLSQKRAGWSFGMLLGDAVVSGQHQTTNILNRLHAGLELRPPVTSSTGRFTPFPSLQGLEVLVAYVVALQARTVTARSLGRRFCLRLSFT